MSDEVIRLGRALALGAGLCIAATQSLWAGGVTFTDIAEGGAAGIDYHRVASPVRQAVQQNFYNNGAPVLPSQLLLFAQTPQKPRGAPGVGLFDYDDDGDLDIYVTNGPGAANSLYQNQLVQTGQVSFVDVAAAAGVTATSQDSSAVCSGDIDNDGDEDLYITGIGEPNVLFLNNGNGTFSDITASAGVGAGTFNHVGCALADFNGDGLLDILVGNSYDDWKHRQTVFLAMNYPGMEPNQLFQRDAGAPGIQFTDVSTTSGVRDLPGFPGGTFTWSVSAVDYDQDGDTDILWTDLQGAMPTGPGEDRGYNRLLRNDGTGHFTDISVQAGMKLGSWMGLAYGDYNCDGNIDFFSTNLGHWVGGAINATRWFLGDGNGGFTDPGLGALNALPFGWGTVAIDYDNDADQDVFFYGDDDLLAFIAMDNPGTVLENPGCSANFQLDLDALTRDHRFREVNGVAAGDINNDGFPDVATVAIFQIEPNQVLVRPYRNIVGAFGTPLDDIAIAQFVMVRTAVDLTRLTYFPVTVPDGDLAIEINSGDNGNGWAQAELMGTYGLTSDGRANRDGIGAVTRFTPEGGKTVIVPIIGGGSHASQSSRIAHYGLGSAQKGTLDVLWPGGVRNRLYDVASGERVRFPEIPCSYDGNWKNFGLYNSCVRTSLNQLVQAGTITHAERERFIASAVRAFNER